MQGSAKDSGPTEHHSGSKSAATRENDESIGEDDLQGQCLIFFPMILIICIYLFYENIILQT